jgi:hypothetical protein
MPRKTIDKHFVTGVATFFVHSCFTKFSSTVRCSLLTNIYQGNGTTGPNVKRIWKSGLMAPACIQNQGEGAQFCDVCVTQAEIRLVLAGAVKEQVSLAVATDGKS